MRDFSTDIAEVLRRIDEAEKYLKVAELRERLASLEQEVARPDLWNDQEHAKRVNSEYASVKGDLDEFDGIARTLDDVRVLHDMAREVDDASQENDIEAGLVSARAALDEVELRSLFIGEHDEADAIVQINAKDGGVDAQDWSAMLLRMFTRWAERRNFAVEMG
ncbi:MAG: PCRF domain-containing protein, partial [Acidimicrobiia bacterium]